MHWTQIYDPLGHWWLSTLVAALPIIVLFSLLAGLKVRPHWCAVAGAGTAVPITSQEVAVKFLPKLSTCPWACSLYVLPKLATSPCFVAAGSSTISIRNPNGLSSRDFG
jgi:hypothetical protein